MTNATRLIGHRTLTLERLSPSISAAFSPNLYSWMGAKGHFYKDGGVLQGVYRVQPDTRLAEFFDAGTLLIGYPCTQHKSSSDFIGIRLISALCEGVKAGSICYAGATSGLQEVVGFWDKYLAVGRCAMDPEHKEHFMDERYSMNGDIRTCRWCGTKHERVVTPRAVFDESWVAV